MEIDHCYLFLDHFAAVSPSKVTPIREFHFWCANAHVCDDDVERLKIAGVLLMIF